MSEERLIKIENKLDNHDKDIHSIAGSLEGIRDQMKRTNDIIQDFAIHEEKFASRIDLLDSKTMDRFERNEELIRRAHDRLDKTEKEKSWIVRLVLGFIFLGFLEAYIRFSPVTGG